MFKQGAFVNILTPNPQDWIDQFRRIEKFPSLDYVELWIEYLPTGPDLDVIKDLFRGTQLIIHGPFLHASLVSHLPEVVAVTERRFEEAIGLATNLGAKIITFHSGSYPLFFSKEHAIEKLVSKFERFSEIHDPVATLENMPMKSHGTVREPLGKLSDFEKILKLLPQLHFTLDIGHCIQNEDDFIPFIRKHASRIENIHLHDGLPRGRAHLGLGAGCLDLNQFLEVLAAVGFNKHVGIETIKPDDTKSSWNLLCDAEQLKGIRKCGCLHQGTPAVRSFSRV